MAEPSSLLRLFGKELKRAREAAGLTQEQLGQKVAYSRGQIGMVENGQRHMKSATVQQVDDLLNAHGWLHRIWLEAGEERSVLRVADLRSAEAAATLIRSYQPALVPGLLQTERYMRGLFSAGVLAGTDQDEIERAVKLRLDRQGVLAAQVPPRYTVVLYESVIRGVVHEEATMLDQLAHLLTMSRHRRVNLQIIPFTSAKYAPAAPLTIIDASGTTIVHLESTLSRSVTTSDPSTVEEAREKFDLLRSHAAPSDQSALMIETRMKELRP